MSYHRLATTVVVAWMMSAGATAQTLDAYREFQLGASVAAVAAATRVAPAAFRTVHERPALLQEFDWRPSHYAQPDTRQDSVEQIGFSFYDDQLSRMVIVYDSRQTASMTRTDLVSALAPLYGAPAPARRVADDPDFGPLAASWQSDSATVELFRGSDAWRLVVTSRALHARALVAKAQALRREEQEAPARDLARQKQEEAAERTRQEQQRRANTAAFQP